VSRELINIIKRVVRQQKSARTETCLTNVHPVIRYYPEILTMNQPVHIGSNDQVAFMLTEQASL
jgi:hypothetical protein